MLLSRYKHVFLVIVWSMLSPWLFGASLVCQLFAPVWCRQGSKADGCTSWLTSRMSMHVKHVLTYLAYVKLAYVNACQQTRLDIPRLHKPRPWHTSPGMHILHTTTTTSIGRWTPMSRQFRWAPANRKDVFRQRPVAPTPRPCKNRNKLTRPFVHRDFLMYNNFFFDTWYKESRNEDFLVILQSFDCVKGGPESLEKKQRDFRFESWGSTFGPLFLNWYKIPVWFVFRTRACFASAISVRRSNERGR